MVNFENIKKEFDLKEKNEDGTKIMEKVAEIVNNVGANFLTMNGNDLADAQSKLAGYKFYLADYIAELNRRFESMKLQIKDIKASKWDEVTGEIKAKEGKVKNKEQIENAISTMTMELQAEQMLCETLYFKYKLKISSIDSILTAIAQRLAELKRMLDQTI